MTEEIPRRFGRADELPCDDPLIQEEEESGWKDQMGIRIALKKSRKIAIGEYDGWVSTQSASEF